MMPFDSLIASALGELSGDAEREAEEHVLSCSRCAQFYESILRLGPTTAELIRAGGAGMAVTRTLVAKLDAEGLISRRYELEPGKPVACTVSPADLYALTTYRVDLAGVSRVDLLRLDQKQRHIDVPFDVSAGRVYLLTASDTLRTLPSRRVPLRLVAVEEAGERTLGEYELNHTAMV